MSNLVSRWILVPNGSFIESDGEHYIGISIHLTFRNKSETEQIPVPKFTDLVREILGTPIPFRIKFKSNDEEFVEDINNNWVKPKKFLLNERKSDSFWENIFVKDGEFAAIPPTSGHSFDVSENKLVSFHSDDVKEHGLTEIGKSADVYELDKQLDRIIESNLRKGPEIADFNLASNVIEMIEEREEVWEAISRAAESDDDFAEEEFNYDTIFGYLSQHVPVLEALGLIVNMKIPVTKLSQSLFEKGTMELMPGSWDSIMENKLVESSKEFMKSHFFYGKLVENKPECFLLNSKVEAESGYTYSMFDYKKNDVEIKQIDPDIKGFTLKSFIEKKSAKKASQEDMPQLPTGGLIFMNKKKTKNEFNIDSDASDLNFYEQDAISGVRPGVYHPSIGNLISLCERNTRYKATGEGEIYDGENDGNVVVDSAVEIMNRNNVRADASSDKYFEFRGFSFALPHPVYGGDSNKEDIEDSSEVLEHVSKTFEICNYYKTEGIKIKTVNLPLRYGLEYGFFLANSYINGYSLPVKTTAGKIECTISDMFGDVRFDAFFSHNDKRINSVKYRRVEPVPPPGVYLDTPLEEIVTSAAGGELPRVIKGKEGESMMNLVTKKRSSVKKATRYILPPPTSSSVAEQFGKYDNISPNDSYDLHKNRAGKQMKEVYDETIKVLPDPLVVRFRISILNKTTKTVLAEEECDFYRGSNWPDYKVWKLETDIGDEVTMKVKKFNQSITLEIPLGDEVEISISSVLPKSKDIGIQSDKNGTDYLWYSYLLSKGIGSISSEILGGNHVNFSPPINLSALSAIKEPPQILFGESIGKEFTKVFRENGSNLAKLICDLKIENKFYNDLIMHSKWEEYIDDPKSNADPSEPIKNKELTLEAKCNEDWKNTGAFVFETDQLDTKHRKKHVVLKGSNAFDQYFHDSKDSEWSEYEIVHIPSTKKPDIPSINKIVPLFFSKFQYDGSDRIRHEGITLPASQYGGVQYEKKGNLLRIYIERGWYSSGEGEKFALIVNKRNSSFELANDLLCSNIGRDYLDATGDQADLLTAESFKTEKYDNVISFDTNRDAVIFSPKFDSSSNLWYVDIELNLKKALYYPFIQFVAARYQQHSLDGLYFSDLVISDFCQITQDRSLNVNYLVGESPFRGEKYSYAKIQLSNTAQIRPNNKFFACLQSNSYNSNNVDDSLWFRNNETEFYDEEVIDWVSSNDGWVELDPNKAKLLRIDAKRRNNFKVVIYEIESYSYDLAGENNTPILPYNKPDQNSPIDQTARIVFASDFGMRDSFYR